MKLHKVQHLLTLICFCWLKSVTSSCKARNLSITVDNIMELYIDGVEKQHLPNADNWIKADSVVLPCEKSVIAVKGTDRGVVAGILASTDDGYILTNSSWKCTNVYYAGWQQTDFNDSSWPWAYSIAVHQTSPWRLVPGIRTDAYWIWTSKYRGGDLVVYCRKAIVPLVTPITSPPCPPRRLTITVDNEMRLYIDGTEKTGLQNANDWTKADTVDLPVTARVIAVQGTDRGVVAGILASTDDGYILTNSSWKCTNVYYFGWQQTDFDDSSWPAAYSVAVHQTSPWRLVPGIRTDAYWIWTPNYRGGDLVVYCRKDLVPMVTPPCPPRRLTITVDNEMRLYIDGIEKTGLQNANDWTKADIVDLPVTARVIAVQGTDRGVVAGILASTDDGYILTNSSWKCTNVYYFGWQQTGFDDSSWPWARSIAVHQTSPWRLVPGIRTDAYWIWTPNYTGGDLVVYCRKDLDVYRPTTFRPHKPEVV